VTANCNVLVAMCDISLSPPELMLSPNKKGHIVRKIRYAAATGAVAAIGLAASPAVASSPYFTPQRRHWARVKL
jgi:hypothetical protein